MKRQELTVKQAKTILGITNRKSFKSIEYSRKGSQEHCIYNLGCDHYFITKITRDGPAWYVGAIDTESKRGVLIKKRHYFNIIKDDHHRMIQKMHTI